MQKMTIEDLERDTSSVIYLHIRNASIPTSENPKQIFFETTKKALINDLKESNIESVYVDNETVAHTLFIEL